MSHYLRKDFYGFYIKEVESEETDHYYGGKEIFKGAICPNCERQLTPLLTIKINDEIRSIIRNIPKSIEKIPLFYCWTCDLFEEKDIVFYYSFDSNSIKYHQAPKGKKVDSWPYKDYPSFFQKIGIELVKYSKEEYQLYLEVCSGKLNWLDVINQNRAILADNTILDNPCFINNKGNMKRISCPLCNKKMKYFGKFGDSEKMQNKFIGNYSPVMVFHFCEECCVIGTYHYVD